MVCGTALFLVSLIGNTVAGNAVPDVTAIYHFLSDDEVRHQVFGWNRYGDQHLNEPSYPVEIHHRTNALGFPFYVEDIGFLEPINENQDLLCMKIMNGESKCDWDVKGFEWRDYLSKPVDSGRLYRFNKSVTVVGCQPSPELTSVTDYCKNMLFGQMNCKIYLIPEKATNKSVIIKGKSFYEFTTDVCGSEIKLKICSYNKLDQLVCDKDPIFKNYTDQSSYLWFEFEHSRIQIWNGKSRENLVFEKEDFLFTESTGAKNLFKIEKGDFDVFYYKTQVLHSTLQNSSMTSRKVALDSKKICVRIMFDCYNCTQEDNLSLSILSDGNFLHLSTLNLSESDNNSWKVETSIPEEVAGQLIQLMLSANTRGTVAIERIASCSTEDKEHVAVITPDMMEYKENITRSLMAIEGIQYKGYNSSMCLNGGVLTSAGCACPAGFAGLNCSRACGFNRFGQDCGGVCSFHAKGCKHLLLCTPAVGCLCGSGYFGKICEKTCDEHYDLNKKIFFYGPNCTQPCGHCSAPCDIFSGECPDCESGFYPPLCKEKYVHLVRPPAVSSTTYGVISVVVNLSKDNIGGLGKPKLYQIQLKEISSDSDYYYSSRSNYYENYITIPITNQTTDEIDISGLKDGGNYTVRVVFIADDFESYSGNDVPNSTIVSKCVVPETHDYDISWSCFTDHVIYYEDTGEVYYRYYRNKLFINANGCTFKWKWNGNLTEHMCPVQYYEILYKLGWEWKRFHTSRSQFEIREILPNQDIMFQVRAKTTGGFAPFSKMLKNVTSYAGGSDTVQNLEVLAVEKDKYKITWNPPKAVEDRIDVNYTVIYQCFVLPFCSSKSCSNADKGSLVVNKTSVLIEPALHSAQYKVFVSAERGTAATVFLGTSITKPTEVPIKSEQNITRTNSSTTVFWDHVEVCSGYFTDYYYELYEGFQSFSSEVLESGRTKDTRATFNNTTASSEYTVRVFVETNMGRNPNTFLLINILPDASAPEAIGNLTVYKKGRHMLGLRWTKPLRTFGELDSFGITYDQLTGTSEISSRLRNTVEPQHCIAWPHLYCYTIESLMPYTTYNVTVSARNKDISKDGAEVSIVAETRESSPGPPENLSIINVTSTSLGLQWDHPKLANGILRSFLVSVEETEQVAQSNCCQKYPVLETTVKEEQPYYQLEVSGLHPASTYSISVSGKTVGFGPSQTLTACTLPPLLDVVLPSVEIHCSMEETVIIEWLPLQNSSQGNISTTYDAPDQQVKLRSDVLLLLSNNSLDSWPYSYEFPDAYMMMALNDKFGNSFTVIRFYWKENKAITLWDSEYFSIHSEEEDLGKDNKLLNITKNQMYMLAAVHLTQINGVYNINTVKSAPFKCKFSGLADIGG